MLHKLNKGELLNSKKSLNLKKINILFSAFINLLAIQSMAEQDPHSHHEVQKIMVFGGINESSLFESVPTVSILSGDRLTKRLGVSLGETLSHEVGVSSSSYGPAASRPIIRGLDGDRIRILQNSLGILDASGASQDHAVSLDPLLMDKIEIVRGPLSLLYGSNALGGVVNILTNRTHDAYENGFSGAVYSNLSSVDNGKSISVKADLGANNFMFHADAAIRDSQDLNINGFARSKQRRMDSPLPLNEEPRNKLPNSQSQSASAALGGTYFFKKGHISTSASTYLSDYGVIAEPDVTISMNQSRFDLVGELKDIGFLKAIRLKSAQSIYKHKEMEGSETGTIFKNNGNETRLEFVQKSTENMSGLFGLQTNVFNFSALGDEAFLPETQNLALALFAYEDFVVNSKSKFNLGARAESNSVTAIPSGSFLNDEKKEFFLKSIALGHLYSLNSKFKISTQVGYNERAPNYQELFANGAHMATFNYEIGDQNLGKEDALSLDVSLRFNQNNFSAMLNVFGQKFNNYITLNPTGNFDDTDESGTAGDSMEDLPIYNTLSKAAEIYGIEFDGRIESVLNQVKGKTDLYVKADYLRGRNTEDNSNLPRMTPPRASIGVTHSLGAFSNDLEIQNVFKQTQVAANETTTDGYTQINFNMSYKTNKVKNFEQLTYFLKANNIFNVEARNHNSILKDIAQLGGRNISLGVRAYF
jgi:iron complex outermembrane recepter protein